MIYKALKFEFKTPVHFGNGSLTDGDFTLHADTIFSALCIEAVKNSVEALDELVELFSSERLKISDAFPYVDDTPFVPKPFCYVERNESTGSSVLKKSFKKLKYVSAKNLESFFTSGYNPQEDIELIKELGQFSLKTSAAINGEEETKPYNIETYTFAGTATTDKHNGGLYVIVGYENEQDYYLLCDYLDSLSYTGIGGRRSSGLGKFTVRNMKLPQGFVDALDKPSGKSMLLSVALPAEAEMESALQNAEYNLIKRSGFVSSYSYSDSFERKKDLFVFNSGSCFANRFNGKIYDVSREGKNHPVYKYAIPMWLGVNV